MRAGKAETETAEPVRLAGDGPPPGPRQIVLVPGAEVPLLRLDLPAGLRGQAREQVARRQIRDRVGIAPDSAEIWPMPLGAGPDDWTRVMVADAARVAEWRALACRAVLPDYLSLPAAEGIWTACATRDEDGIMVRLGPGDGFSASPELAPVMLDRAFAETQTPPSALYRTGPPLPALEAVCAARGIPVLSHPDELEARGLPPLRPCGEAEAALDLRRDPSAARARLRRRVLPLIGPLLVAALAALLWGVAERSAIARSEARTAATAAATEALVRQHFLPSGPLLDIRSQVARALAGMRAGGAAGEAETALELLARTADLLAASPARTELVTYGAADGLAVVLHLPDFAAVETLAADLRAGGLAVTVADSRTEDSRDGVRSELRLAPGPEAPR